MEGRRSRPDVARVARDPAMHGGFYVTCIVEKVAVALRASLIPYGKLVDPQAQAESAHVQFAEILIRGRIARWLRRRRRLRDGCGRGRGNARQDADKKDRHEEKTHHAQTLTHLTENRAAPARMPRLSTALSENYAIHMAQTRRILSR
jgi:hypothetical protein